MQYFYFLLHCKQLYYCVDEQVGMCQGMQLKLLIVNDVILQAGTAA